jgi:hypothetical protein
MNEFPVVRKDARKIKVSASCLSSTEEFANIALWQYITILI